MNEGSSKGRREGGEDGENDDDNEEVCETGRELNDINSGHFLARVASIPQGFNMKFVISKFFSAGFRVLNPSN